MEKYRMLICFIVHKKSNVSNPIIRECHRITRRKCFLLEAILHVKFKVDFIVRGQQALLKHPLMGRLGSRCP